MEEKQLGSKIKNATKWSALTETLTRLIAPITNIVLARLLTPEAFGVVATITMIISFAEIFTDAGFQKYLIQHEFKDTSDREQSTTVAFWSNFIMSVVIWVLIICFCEPLASLVGNPGMGYVVAIACVSIPLAAFSSIQMALYKRDLDFKTLFKVRIVGICVPLFVTVPLAFVMRSFWALVIGTIVKDLINAVLLTWYSAWRPRLFYSITKLKEMLSFTIWSLVEAITIWLTGYLDIFIVGRALSVYYLGVYKTSMTTAGQIIGLITAATTPILFSGLSRLQDDNKAFTAMFLTFQRWVGMLVLPLGVGLYCYSDLVTTILLGDQWMEASGFIGIWGLMSVITILFGHYCSEVFRAKGRPKLSVVVQTVAIAALLPAVLLTVDKSFATLYTARSFARLAMVAADLVIVYFLIRLTPLQMMRNLLPATISCLVMAAWALTSRSFMGGILGWTASALIATLIYFAVIMLFPRERAFILAYAGKAISQIKNRLHR